MRHGKDCWVLVKGISETVLNNIVNIIEIDSKIYTDCNGNELIKIYIAYNTDCIKNVINELNSLSCVYNWCLK